ncbi:MAG: tRNA (guanosine(46)-N7)-methyltransferase TrmB [Defluviitaleaceae bacterium]|nr:tRNA (guanosine(46)-N7)-methyltransferase TrmB [Defluviitaleaceae bacterium]
MRTRKKKWSAGELENNPRILRDESEYSGRLREFFGNDSPIHLELGCGKGRFIIETSRRNPDINYIAIERDETILATAARRAEENSAESLVFVLADVNEGLEFLKPADISRLYINFCDPWSRKKKWAKRRLTHDTFLQLYENLQIPELFFKTDNRILFESSIESLSRRNWLIENISLDLHAENLPDNIMTEYEEKFSAHGPIYRLEAKPRGVHIMK